MSTTAAVHFGNQEGCNKPPGGQGLTLQMYAHFTYIVQYDWMFLRVLIYFMHDANNIVGAKLMSAGPVV